MKSILKFFLKKYLKFFSKLILFFWRPKIIAIAGSTNKTFVKQEIERILKQKGISCRSNSNSFNTEIGLPLAILNLPSGYNRYFAWLPTIIHVPMAIFKKQPDYLILELGVSSRNDMRYLLTLIKPKISVITEINQRYLEGFCDMDNMVKEFTLIAKKNHNDGLLILNYDNTRIMRISEMIKHVPIKSFSIDNPSDYQATKINKTEIGQSFIINGNEQNIEYFGRHHIYAFLVGHIINDYVVK